ncbi:hypothetical protein SAMN04515695_0363 [Pseudovibrio sp. Tun.PSC04-5.I4]|nr:hypothetical protein SAMN04515695_0363 [Pseudovibrio sp. Tun.PSC04-5.I4]
MGSNTNPVLHPPPPNLTVGQTDDKKFVGFGGVELRDY